jgi:hypothetical protein
MRCSGILLTQIVRPELYWPDQRLYRSIRWASDTEHRQAAGQMAPHLGLPAQGWPGEQHPFPSQMQCDCHQWYRIEAISGWMVRRGGSDLVPVPFWAEAGGIRLPGPLRTLP